MKSKSIKNVSANKRNQIMTISVTTTTNINNDRNDIATDHYHHHNHHHHYHHLCPFYESIF